MQNSHHLLLIWRDYVEATKFLPKMDFTGECNGVFILNENNAKSIVASITLNSEGLEKIRHS